MNCISVGAAPNHQKNGGIWNRSGFIALPAKFINSYLKILTASVSIVSHIPKSDSNNGSPDIIDPFLT